jgi:hypothetical protein
VTIVAAAEFDRAHAFTIEYVGKVARPGSVSHFFRVPEHASALNVAFRITSGRLNMRIHDANARNVDSSMAFNGPGYQSAGTWSRAFEHPVPGVWEVILENGEDDQRLDRSFANPLPPSEYTLAATLFGADVSLVPNASDPAAPSIHLTNRLSPFTGSLHGSTLGTLRTERATVTVDRPRSVFDIDVPPGTERLLVEIGDSSDERADLDLYLFDCTGSRCALRAFGTEQGARERVSAFTPTAGRWKVVVDGFAMPAGVSRFEYREVLMHPLFGRIEARDESKSHSGSDEWESSVAWNVLARPQNGRTLVGYVELIADGVTHTERTARGINRLPSPVARAMLELDTRPR